MQFVGWMFDVAREQSPKPKDFRLLLERSLAAGYNAVGLYLEHRFEYHSAPWAMGHGALTTEAVSVAQQEFVPKGLRLIPFLNTLGHMEGFIKSEGGQWLAEGKSQGSQQMCPSRRECIEFARKLVEDALNVFVDPWVHLGGDETWQLGQCSICAERAESIGKEGIYGEYFGSLCEWVLKQGRRPCLWADMLLQYPEALQKIPKETILFDWQYDKAPKETTTKLIQAGYEVVCCPSVHTYDASWCHLALTQKNIDDHIEDAIQLETLGVLVTTWEFSYFTQYLNTLPIIYAAGKRIVTGEEWRSCMHSECGAEYAMAAEIIGNEIPAYSEFMQPGTWRPLRDRLIIRQNPFYLWQEWRSEACGSVGDKILSACEKAEKLLKRDDPLRFAVDLHQYAVLWVRQVEKAYEHYKMRDLLSCKLAIRSGYRYLLRLASGLHRAVLHGGSTTDLLRLKKMGQVVERVDTWLSNPLLEASAKKGYLPAFEVLIHDAFLPGDQAAWRVSQYL